MAKYRGRQSYMGAWSYILLEILYSVPVIGFVFLLVHSFNSNNENRMHYARSFFARMLIVLIVSGITVGILFLVLGSSEFIERIEEIEIVLEEFVENVKLPQF